MTEGQTAPGAHGYQPEIWRSRQPDTSQAGSPRILVVTRKGHMTEPVMDYALLVADRLNYAILAVYVDTLPLFRDGGARNRRFLAAMQESSGVFARKAAARGISFDYIGETGNIVTVIHRLCHSTKRIEFIVIDKGISRPVMASRSPVPVFSVIYTDSPGNSLLKTSSINHLYHGESTMPHTTRRRYVKRSLLFGVAAAALYTAVFTNAETIMAYTTRGGLYCLLPVATVFAFSYIHGSFTSAFWSALGIEGSRKTTSSQPVKRSEKADTARKRKDTRPRAQLNT